MSDAHGSHDPGPGIDHASSAPDHFQMMHDQRHREFMASDPAHAKPWDGNRTVLIGYVLWLFLGSVGAHRFYVGRWKSGLGMAAAGFVTWILTSLLVPSVGVPMMIWWIVDAFLIPRWIRVANEENAARRSPEAPVLVEKV
ncbi:TM2 domain-containing protein [Brevundimonas sp.]|jgi:TM2 domain-containing membrane protein YozV|uniref:TM2 domain-containing protein n=1 Tax=Brevundimonas sp. TaxID=1871086 RepID=UPI00391A9D25